MAAAAALVLVEFEVMLLLAAEVSGVLGVVEAVVTGFVLAELLVAETVLVAEEQCLRVGQD